MPISAHLCVLAVCAQHHSNYPYLPAPSCAPIDFCVAAVTFRRVLALLRPNYSLIYAYPLFAVQLVSMRFPNAP